MADERYILIRPPQLPELAEVGAGAYVVGYDSATDRTVKINVSALGGAEQVTDLIWRSNVEYELNEIKEYGLKLWKSKIAGNQGNIPAENQYWTEVSKAGEGGGITNYVPGVYTYNPTIVLRFEKLYRLAATLPFESTDFDAELELGRWRLLNDSKIIGVAYGVGMTGNYTFVNLDDTLIVLNSGSVNSVKEGTSPLTISLSEPSYIVKTGAGNTLSDFTILPIFGWGISWLELTDRPAWLSPASLALFEAAHGHDWSLIANKPATATRWPSWAEVTSKPETFTPAAHNQAISTITGLQAALDNKAEKAGDITQDFHVKDLNIAGQVNQWLAQQVVVDDARIQVNRRQGGATVDSGLVIYNKDTSSEVSSLVYDVNGIWRAGGERIYTDAYKPLADNATNLGGYSAASYPRKAEAAVITEAWSFRNGVRSVSNTNSGVTLLTVAEGGAYQTMTNAAGITRNLFRTYGDSFFLGNLALGLDTASERLHVVGNGLFTGDVKLPTGNVDIGVRNGDGLRFRNSDSFKIYFSQSSDATLGGNLAGTADYNMYFKTSGGNRGWAFKYDNNIVAQIQGNGNFSVTGNVTAQNITLSGNLTSNSDIRKKENLKSVDNVLDKVLILKPTKYNFKNDESKRERIGLIAQELQEEFPQFVEEDDTEDKYLSVDYAGISVIAIKAIQELNDKLISQIEIMGNRIKELEDKIDGLCN